METTTKTLPANLTVHILSKWMEGEYGKEEIKMRLSLCNSANNTRMEFNYGGGLEAFLPKEKAIDESLPWDSAGEVYGRSLALQKNVKIRARVFEIKKGLNTRVRTTWDKAIRDKAVALALASVELDPIGILYTLISDADCGESSFDDFCANCGYDPDSRKAEGVWNASRENARQLRGVLKNQFDEIQKLVRDY